jgi:hypothetical protein
MTQTRRLSCYLFILLLAVYLLTASLRIDTGDGEAMVAVACNLAAGQGLDVEVDPADLVDGRTGYGRVGREGLYYAKYGLGWSLAAAPLCALGRGLAGLLPGATEGFVTRAAVLVVNPLLTACAAALLFRLACRLYPVRHAATLALLYGLGTIAWYYAKSAFSEPLTTALMIAAVYAVERGRFGAAGVALGGALLTRQTAVFMLVPVVVWALARVWRDGARAVLLRGGALLLPVALGQSAALGYNVYRFGSPLAWGYGPVGWDTPLLRGLYGQLLSPGKGLLVFNPLLVAGVVGWPFLLRRRRGLGWLLPALFVCHLVPHSLYRDWTGGGGWGPRMLLPAVPFALLPAGELFPRLQARLAGRLLLAFLVSVSVLVQATSVLAGWARHLQRVRSASATYDEYFYRAHYRWADAPIVGQVRSLAETVAVMGDAGAREGLRALVGPEVGLPLRDWQSEAVGLLSFSVPDLWFVYLWFLGVGAGWLIGAGLVLCGVATGAALGLRRVLGEA